MRNDGDVFGEEVVDNGVESAGGERRSVQVENGRTPETFRRSARILGSCNLGALPTSLNISERMS